MTAPSCRLTLNAMRVVRLACALLDAWYTVGARGIAIELAGYDCHARFAAVLRSLGV